MSEKTEPSVDRNILSGIACSNYVNGFFASFGSDCCENCGEREAKHEGATLDELKKLAPIIKS